jgi:hypothetical protein
MSQQYPHPYPFLDLNPSSFTQPLPTPPPTTTIDTYANLQLPTTYYPYAFSPSQLTALLDERIQQLGAYPAPPEPDMNLGGIDFPALQRYVCL